MYRVPYLVIDQSTKSTVSTARYLDCTVKGEETDTPLHLDAKHKRSESCGREAVSLPREAVSLPREAVSLPVSPPEDDRTPRRPEGVGEV